MGCADPSPFPSARLVLRAEDGCARVLAGTHTTPLAMPCALLRRRVRKQASTSWETGKSRRGTCLPAAASCGCGWNARNMCILHPNAGGKLVYQYMKKKASHPICGATGARLHGVSRAAGPGGWSLPSQCSAARQLIEQPRERERGHPLIVARKNRQRSSLLTRMYIPAGRELTGAHGWYAGVSHCRWLLSAHLS